MERHKHNFRDFRDIFCETLKESNLHDIDESAKNFILKYELKDLLEGFNKRIKEELPEIGIGIIITKENLFEKEPSPCKTTTITSRKLICD